MTFDHRAVSPTINLYRGDSMKLLEAKNREHPNGFADLVLTDPPYGIDYKSSTGKTVLNDKEPPIHFVRPMVTAMKPDSTMLLFTRWDVWPAWQKEMQRCGLTIDAPIIWRKGSGSLGDSVSDQALNYEMCLVGRKGSPLHQWPAADNPSDGKVWPIPVPRDRRSRRHPTPKPSQLMEKAIAQHTDEGALVLDPFMGGAPVGVAAVRLGRGYIGAELDPGNFGLAIENVQRELAKQDAIRRIQERLLPKLKAEAADYAKPTHPKHDRTA